jgi:hypothetical protein
LTLVWKCGVPDESYFAGLWEEVGWLRHAVRGDGMTDGRKVKSH